MELGWVPRLQNEEADALTNHDFAAFDPRRRVDIDPAKLDFTIMDDLMGVADELYSDTRDRRADRGAKDTGTRSGKLRLKERDPWT